MNPTDNMREQVAIAERYGGGELFPDADSARLAHLVLALDQHLCGGGNLPAPWAEARLKLEPREFHTILAALRCYEDYLRTHPIYPGYDDIASNLGAVKPLEADEVAALCETLNNEGEEI